MGFWGPTLIEGVKIQTSLANALNAEVLLVQRIAGCKISNVSALLVDRPPS